MTQALLAEGLAKRFGAVTALAGIDLEIAAGEVLGLLGPNGAGKTTTVRLLSTLMRPDEGRAVVAGYDVVSEAARVREHIALTGQYVAVDEGLTGFENLLLIGRLLELGRTEARDRAEALLEEFGLAEAAGRTIRTYSGGMRRRLDLAASMISRPRVLFLDEPTTGLDPKSRLDVWATVRRFAADGMAVLLTTQYMEEADRLADNLVVVDRGTVVARGTADALKAKVGDRTLVVRPDGPFDLEAVHAAVREVAPHCLVEKDGTVTVPSADGALMSAVLNVLQGHGLPVDEVALRKPSLDEVFLAIVGTLTKTNDRSEA